MGCTNSSLEISHDSESEVDVYLEKMTHISADITEKIIRKNKKPLEPRKSKCGYSESSEEPKQDYPIVSITLSQGQDEEKIIAASGHSSIDMP